MNTKNINPLSRLKEDIKYYKLASRYDKENIEGLKQINAMLMNQLKEANGQIDELNKELDEQDELNWKAIEVLLEKIKKLNQRL